MLEGRLLREPLAFLVRFAVIAGVLYLVRGEISRLYLVLVAPPANWLLGDGAGVAYLRQGRELALDYRGLGLRFTVHDILYQNLMVAVALFGATRSTLRWKLAWGGAAIAVLWVTHVASLVLGAHAIVWDFVLGLPEAARAEIAPRVAARFPAGQDGLFSRLFGVWHTWGRTSLALVVWVVAARRLLWSGEGRDAGQAGAGT